MLDEALKSIYKPNLRKLLGLHRERAETAILMSQGANPALVRLVGQDSFIAESFANLGQFAVSLRLVNIATAEVCAESADVCVFLDLANNVRFEPNDFYDVVHTTPAGNKKIAEFLAQRLAVIAPGYVTPVAATSAK